jgi:hypothetical protein
MNDEIGCCQIKTYGIFLLNKINKQHPDPFGLIRHCGRSAATAFLVFQRLLFVLLGELALFSYGFA